MSVKRAKRSREPGKPLDEALRALVAGLRASARPSMIIAAWRPQDQQDTERLIALHGEHIDLERVRAFAHDLATTLDDPQRVEEVEKMLSRARASIDREVAPGLAQRAGRTPRRK